MKLFRTLAQNLKIFQKARQVSQSTDIQNASRYSEKISKHRSVMKLYDLRPYLNELAYVAPNSTVVGEVTIGNDSIVMYNSVVRGDINAVEIGNHCYIGENVVIHTAGSLPTGQPAVVQLGTYVQVGNRCTLYSCVIEDECVIGSGSVVLEGAKIQQGSMIAPNSVVPPGRIIPAGQLWAGNPVAFVRDLDHAEIATNNANAVKQCSTALVHRDEFLQYSSAYLQKQNSQEDLNPSEYKDVTPGFIPKMKYSVSDNPLQF